MTPEEVDAKANELRLRMQHETHCPACVIEVCLRLLAGFALDCAQGNQHEAAADVVRDAKEMAKAVRTGNFVLQRLDS